ncbi:DeoR/GlpR family DNA-binding transcription regulator [Paraflavitalea pollutisoli]|uniref:DeoR/GlpR family DNA-binding transcription regulator n=1 Tax=Paraflavitalea pollutisoli TaxID=3034143 RepID=UPI0023EB7C00|nr:DeoR/GlpR family DNA-binding transcription regulator [Paraflavitalea sp. H1-2-19X]
MLKKERQAYILRQVNLHNKVLSSTLSSEINVSEDTIRRDLHELAEDGRIIKVHGGALSHSFHDLSNPSSSIYLHDHKKVIAEKAASLIEDGMYILTSGGSTILELARVLPPQLRATFVSGSLPAIVEYLQHPNIDVIVIGDKISKNSRITVGGEAISKIGHIRADLCFLGIDAISVQHGVSDSDWDVVQLKKAMIESSQKVVCLSIAEKTNSVKPVHVCPVSSIHTLITELPPGDPALQPYVNMGIEVL